MDKMGKNRCLSVRFWKFRPEFYGQITGKCLFVRKMRFAYGQISKNWRLVRKFERYLVQINLAALYLIK